MQSTNNILARYQLPLFFLLSYLLSWWSAPLADGQLIPHGPALAAVIVLAIGEGRQGLAVLWRRVTNWRVPWIWFVAGPAVIAGYHAVGFALNLLLGAEVASLPHLSPSTFLELLLLGGLWEEPGWSGYALPKLQERFADHPHGLLMSALVLGALRSLWHLPLFLYGHIPWFDICLFSFAFQLIIAWIFYRSGGSGLVTMVFHFVSNLMGSFTYPVFTGAAHTTYTALFMAVAILFALALVWKGQFNHRPQQWTSG